MTKQSDIATRRALARKVGDAEYHQRRADIMSAAARVFRRKGFQASSLLDIAQETGVDRASLYYYVSGKEELFQEVVLQATLDNVVMVESIQASVSSAPEKIATLIERLMHSYERHYPYLFVYVQENISHLDDKNPWSRKMRAFGKRFDDAVTGIVQQGFDAGTLSSPAITDSRIVAYALIGMCNWSHRWFNPGGKRTAKDISDAFSEMVLRGLSHPLGDGHKFDSR